MDDEIRDQEEPHEIDDVLAEDEDLGEDGAKKKHLLDDEDVESADDLAELEDEEEEGLDFEDHEKDEI